MTVVAGKKSSTEKVKMNH